MEFLAEFWSFGMVLTTITFSWLFGVRVLGDRTLWSFSDGIKAHLRGDLEPFLYLLVMTSVVLTTIHAGFVIDFLIRDADSVIGNITENWNIWRSAVCLQFSAANYVVFRTQKIRKTMRDGDDNLVRNLWEE